MKKEFVLKGHIIDSLILSKLLDQISDLGIECYTSDIKIGQRRIDMSEATFIIDSDDNGKIELATEIAKKHGAIEK